MNGDRVKEIRARLNAVMRPHQGLADDIEAEVEFDAHAPSDIEWLLDEVERLNQRVRMYEVVKS